MKAKLLNDGVEKTYALVLETGDDVLEVINRFATEQELKANHFTAIGAFIEAEVGFFDFSKKDYNRIPIKEQTEVLSLTGDITVFEGKPQIHAQVVLGKSDGTAHGGHLLKAIVHPTLEIILVESPSSMQRKMDAASGIPLIEL